jgi:hypothetical protein
MMAAYRELPLDKERVLKTARRFQCAQPTAPTTVGGCHTRMVLQRLEL